MSILDAQAKNAVLFELLALEIIITSNKLSIMSYNNRKNVECRKVAALYKNPKRVESQYENAYQGVAEEAFNSGVLWGEMNPNWHRVSEELPPFITPTSSIDVVVSDGNGHHGVARLADTGNNKYWVNNNSEKLDFEPMFWLNIKFPSAW